MQFRRTIIRLLAAALVLPILTTLLIGLGRLLAALGDEAGARGVERFALAAGVVWVLVLVLLVVAQAAEGTLNHDEPRDPPVE